MKIRKAVITAAAPAQAHLPLQTVVNQAGKACTALSMLLDEVTHAGIEEVAIVVCPGDQQRYIEAAGNHGQQLTFFEQPEARGYGHALLQSRPFVEDSYFLHLVSDHLYVSRDQQSCAQQLIAVAEREQCSVSAIQPTRENKLAHFGAIGGQPVAQQPGLFEVHTVMEKPTPTVAEQRLIVAGQRAGHYLCLFGMHVLSSHIFDLLSEEAERVEENQPIHLSPGLDRLSQTQRYLASQLRGERYNIGEKYGLLFAQLAIALAGEERDDVLTELVELVARK